MPHVYLDGTKHSVNTIYCIGRSYVEHIKELGNALPDEPLVFLKPNSSLCTDNLITLPNFSDNIHHEVELVLLIGDNQSIAGVSVGLDLTARDIQETCKAKGLPWTKAKGFKNACWVGEFSPLMAGHDYELFLSVNDQVRQHDSTAKMMYSLDFLVNYLHEIYGLRPGDLIFTGTPKGVGKLVDGDCLTVRLDKKSYQLQTKKSHLSDQ